jgi:hypothetical protein
MAYTVEIERLIDYPPSAIRSFHCYAYEWIDNLHFLLAPANVLARPESYVAVARERFLDAGWWSGGEISLLWLPPFVFPKTAEVSTLGLILWHVKQEDDGISWLLSPMELPFERFSLVRQIPDPKNWRR